MDHISREGYFISLFSHCSAFNFSTLSSGLVAATQVMFSIWPWRLASLLGSAYVDALGLAKFSIVPKEDTIHVIKVVYEGDEFSLGSMAYASSRPWKLGELVIWITSLTSLLILGHRYVLKFRLLKPTEPG